MKHYREIDILRGIAITMIFLGHAVIVYPINLENVVWCRGLVTFISTVHMPLFFIVAGFCFHMKNTYKDMIHKKIQRLLIPYIAFNLIDMCCRLIFSKLVNRPCRISESLIKILLYGGEYWFLYVLFLMCMLWGLFQGWVRKHVWLQVIVGMGVIALNILPVSSEIFKADSLCKYFIFFYIGFLIQLHFEIFSDRKSILKNTGTLIVGGITWIIVFVMWYLCNAVFIPQLCVSVLGIFACLVFAIKICNSKLGLILADIGKDSLQLYLLNGYFLVVSRTFLVQVLACTNPFVIVIGNTVFDLAGAFLLAKYVVMRTKVLRVLCGEAYLLREENL